MLTLAAEELPEQEALTLNWVTVLCEQAAQLSLPLLATELATLIWTTGSKHRPAGQAQALAGSGLLRGQRRSADTQKLVSLSCTLFGFSSFSLKPRLATMQQWSGALVEAKKENKSRFLLLLCLPVVLSGAIGVGVAG